jgi:hypothetical protein
MRRETINSVYRGVLCFYCGKPMQLSEKIIGRANAIKNQDSTSTRHLMSRVFLLRCRSCVREAVYTIDQVNDFSETRTSQQSDLV